jgi:hypothetical protein
VRNMTLIVITYDPAAMPSGMLTIDQFCRVLILFGQR